MARNGKIARLPSAVRAQLNSRLQDGGEGKQIVQWLNSLPEVREVLQETFNGNPVTEQNLSDWRLGGFQEWRVCQDLLAQAAELAAHRQELEAVAPGQTPADILAEAVTFRYSAILAGQGPELDEQALAQLNALSRICQAVVQLRRSNQYAARQKIETERWELEKETIRADNSEAMQRKIRAALEARVTSLMKLPECHEKLGGTPDAARTAAILREIEICTDPAHFHSDVIGNPEWDGYVEKLRKEAPPKKTEVQAALDTYHEMEAGLDLSDERMTPKSKRRRPARVAQATRLSRSATRRPAAEPEQSNSAPSPAAEVHEVHEVHSAPTPAAPSAPAEDVASSLQPDSPQAEAAPPGGSEAPIVPNRAQSCLIVPNRA